MNEKERAEKYVRSKCPELMELSFGCEIYDADAVLPWTKRLKLLAYNGKTGTIYCQETDGSIFQRKTKLERYEIIGHPIQLQHWLRVVEKHSLETFKRTGTEHFYVTTKNCLCMNEVATDNEVIVFNLTTGQPATEADYKAFNQILGI